MKTSSSCKNVDKGVRRVDSCGDKLMPDDQVASEDKKSIDNVGNGFDNVQHDSRLGKILRWI